MQRGRGPSGCQGGPAEVWCVSQPTRRTPGSRERLSKPILYVNEKRRAELLLSPSAALPGSRPVAEPSAGCDMMRLRLVRGIGLVSVMGRTLVISELSDLRPHIRLPRNPCYPFHDPPAEVRTVWSMGQPVPQHHPLEQSTSRASSLDPPRGLRLCHDCVNCLELDRLPAVPSREECRLMGEKDSAWTGASLVIHS